MHKNNIFFILIAQIPIAFFFLSRIDHSFAQIGLGILFFVMLNLLVFIFGALVPKILIFNFILKSYRPLFKIVSAALMSFFLILMASVNKFDFGNAVLLALTNTIVLVVLSLAEIKFRRI